jgi:hypothetical protein
MLIQKILETQLDLVDPDDIFDPNLIGMCLRLLTKKFVNRCFKSCLVVKINRILKHSKRYMREDLSGSASINVLFEVNGITFSKGEIINGCNILKIEADGRIHAKSKYAGIQVRQDANLMGIYKEGQVVPFVTRRVMYNPAQTAASVEALPFAPEFPELEIYVITRGLSEDDAAKSAYLFGKLDALIQSIDERLKKDSGEKKALDFFQDLIYPFKKPTEKKLAGFAKRHLASISKIESGAIYQPVELNICSREFYYSESAPEAKAGEADSAHIYEKDLMFVIEKILNRTIQHYSALLEFIAMYPTFAKIQEYKDIWRVYNMLKR